MNPLSLLGARAKWIGTGFALGMLAAPLVKKGIAKMQPKFDEFMEFASSQAEGVMEKGADLVAKARENVQTTENETAAPSNSKSTEQPSA